MRLSSANLLRIAAAVEGLLCLGHSAGGLSRWSPAGNNPVLSAMAAFEMPVMGVQRSFLDFYIGFGWIISVAMLSQAVLMWVTASASSIDCHSLRAFIAIYAVWSLLTAILAALLIFQLPAILATVVALILIAAYRGVASA